MPVVLLAPVPASAQGADTTRVYSFYAVHAAADGVSAQFVVEGLLPVDEFVGLSSVTSDADLGPLRATSLAALPDPGDLVLTLPGTLSALAGISGLPDYPAAASADHPSVPEDEVVFAPDAGLGVGHLRAEATADRAAASASVADLRDTVGLLPSLSIGSIRTTVETVRRRPGVLEATATSELGDVRLTGGLLRIAEVTSTVHVTRSTEHSRPTAPTSRSPAWSWRAPRWGSRVTGSWVWGSPSRSAPAVERLRRPLDAAGVEVKTTPGHREVGEGEITADGGSLDISAPLSVDGYPGRFVLRLAPVSVSLQEVMAPDGLGGGRRRRFDARHRPFVGVRSRRIGVGLGTGGRRTRDGRRRAGGGFQPGNRTGVGGPPRRAPGMGPAPSVRLDGGLRRGDGAGRTPRSPVRRPTAGPIRSTTLLEVVTDG